MTSSEMAPHNDPNVLRIQSGEVGQSPEGLKVEPRIVVVGTFEDGPNTLYHDLSRYLEERGLSDIDVCPVKQTTGVQDAFYGRYPKPENDRPALEAPQDGAEEPTSLVRRMGGQLLSMVGRGKSENDTPLAVPHSKPDTLPMGVLVLPQMRQRYPGGGANSSVPTPVDRIEKLCAEHGVPMIQVERISEEDVAPLLRQLEPPKAKDADS